MSERFGSVAQTILKKLRKLLCENDMVLGPYVGVPVTTLSSTILRLVRAWDTLDLPKFPENAGELEALCTYMNGFGYKAMGHSNGWVALADHDVNPEPVR